MVATAEAAAMVSTSETTAVTSAYEPAAVTTPATASMSHDQARPSEYDNSEQSQRYTETKAAFHDNFPFTRAQRRRPTAVRASLSQFFERA